MASSWMVTMFLADDDLISRLPVLDFKVESQLYVAFDPTVQVQPCSIDLRLGDVFWIRSGRGPEKIDLRDTDRKESETHDGWRRHRISPGQPFTVQPGKFILGRTLERLSMPNDLLGIIEGRSTYGRLGLMVNCSASVINPGWKGFLPIELVNLNDTDIIVYPGMSLCQILVAQLSAVPSRSYSDPALYNKYVNDDGGPAYWWRDEVTRRLVNQMERQDISFGIRSEVVRRLTQLDEDGMSRLEKHIERRAVGEFTSATEIITGFALLEDRRERRSQLLRRGVLGGAAVGAGASISLLFAHPFGFAHYIVWLISFGFAMMAGTLVYREDRQYFGSRRLKGAIISDARDR